MGRKRKYTKKMVKIARTMFLLGASNVDVYKALKIGEATFYEYMNKYPEFAEARADAMEINVMKVEDSLLKRAVGYIAEETLVEVKQTAGGKEIPTAIKKTKKHIPADVAAIRFYLKNMSPEKWKEIQDINIKADAVADFFEKLNGHS